MPSCRIMRSQWPLVEEADLLTHGRQGISRGNIPIVKADRPFVSTGKGTIGRKRTEEAYANEMKAFHDGLNH